MQYVLISGFEFHKSFMKSRNFFKKLFVFKENE